jgi:hypothetical protein
MLLARNTDIENETIGSGAGMAADSLTLCYQSHMKPEKSGVRSTLRGRLRGLNPKPGFSLESDPAYNVKNAGGN